MSRKIKIHDFKRPDVLKKEDIREAAQRMMRFAQLSSTSQFGISCDSVDQLTFEEFGRSVPTPCFMAVYTVKHKRYGESRILMELDTVIARAALAMIFDSVLDQTSKRNDLSDLEWKITERFCHDLTCEMCDCFGIELLCTEETFRSPEVMTKYFDWSGMACTTTFEVRSSVLGVLNYIFDAAWISKIVKPEREDPPIPKEDVSLDLTVPVSVTFTPIKMKLKDVSSIKLGTILTAPDGKYEVRFGGASLFTAKALGGGVKKRVEVLEKLRRNKETKDMSVVNDLNDMKVEVAVEIGRTEMTLRKVKQIGEGSILELDKMAGEPVDIYAGNALIAKGEVVIVGETMGVRVVDMSAGLPE